MAAHLCVNTWAGRREYPVEIVKETAKRYKIRLNGNEILPGNRVACKGDEVYVPKYAIRHDGVPMHALTTTPHRLVAERPNVARELLIRAKQRRIASLEGWATPQTLEREKAELAKLEGGKGK